MNHTPFPATTPIVPPRQFTAKACLNLPYGPYGERNLLDAYLPVNRSKARPAVILIHGGGWTGGSKAGREWYGRDLARRGIAAFALNYRFWPASRYPAAVEDVQLAVRWIRAHAGEFGVNPNRIGGMGCSAGGHLGSLLALEREPVGRSVALRKYSHELQCMADIYGPVDFVAMMDSASKNIVEGFMGKPFSIAKKRYMDASPITHISRDAPPFLIAHGTEDIGVKEGEVPFSISASFYTKLRAAGARARFLAIPGAGHGFMGRHESPAARLAWKAALQLFAECLCAGS